MNLSFCPPEAESLRDSLDQCLTIGRSAKMAFGMVSGRLVPARRLLAFAPADSHLNRGKGTKNMIQESIESKVHAGLAPSFLEVINESSMHNVPEGSESHFRLRIVTDAFAGVSRVQRHRQVHGLLEEELHNGIHALTLELLTPEEWQAKGLQGAESPACMGGDGATRTDNAL